MQAGVGVVGGGGQEGLFVWGGGRAWGGKGFARSRRAGSQVRVVVVLRREGGVLRHPPPPFLLGHTYIHRLPEPRAA